MRLIDADELEYEILHTDFEIVKHECKDYESYVNGANCFRSKAKNLINKAPTEDVVPRAEVEDLQKRLADYERVVGKLSFTVDGAVILVGDETEYIPKSLANSFKNLAVKQAKQEVAKDTVEIIQAHLNMIFKELQNEKTEATVEKLIEINSKIAILESIQLALGDLQNKYIGE